ncbi:hypothetical protein RND71_004433 [Anisodus tanguticus]|uniref:Uncharacterized protein n=1 Tax=Anisodus tanguticus TaxID=243964 RepID=A0AAE1SZN1_9SOLA|nr:hypothetical protein RND71_004433 [Anisodus tanguticus]
MIAKRCESEHGNEENMSQRPHHTNTEKGKAVATSQPIAKRAAPRRAPSTNAIESDEYVDDTPRFVYDAVEFHGQTWFIKFQPKVPPATEEEIDFLKLHLNYFEFYNKLVNTGLDYLLNSMGDANHDIVWEFYANWISGLTFTSYYGVSVRGRRVKFSYKVINEVMRFLEVSFAEYDKFLRRPDC